MPGIFSGDGSVKWIVEANNVREASSTLYPPEADEPRRVVQSGVDETDPDQYFTIEIKAPRDEDEREAFIKELTEQVKNLKRIRTVTIRLPIEDERRNGGKATGRQIVVSWPSSKSARPGGRQEKT